MRHIANVLIILLIGLHSHAQSSTQLGIKGGLNLTFFNVVENGFGSNTDTETGFYVGIFTDFEIDDTFSIQPEILFIGLGDFNFLNAPIYATYEVADNLDILVGPSLNYFFDFFANKFKVRGDIATAYKITQKLDVHIKYTLGFEEISPNGLFFGLGYRL